MRTSLEDPRIGLPSALFGDISRHSHFAGLVRGVCFLAALAVPLLIFGAVDPSTPRARRLTCVDRALAALDAGDAASLLPCHQK